MTDWARHQQSAQMTTQNLQATLQDLLYNNYEPTTNLSFSHLTISHTTEKGTRQIWVTHVKLCKTISYVEQALSCYVPYFLLSNNTNACTTLYTQYCKRSVASSNKQSKSHRETVNTYTANAVNWI